MIRAPDWLELNRQHLLGALARVRAAVEGSDHAGADAMSEGVEDTTADEVQPPFALAVLVERFGLSSFERDVLLLAAGPELDGRFQALLAAKRGDARGQVTFSLALAVLPDAHWSACTPAGALRHWRLIELGTSDALMSAPLRVAECVLHYLVGTPHADERLRGVVDSFSTKNPLPNDRQTATIELAERWWRTAHTAQPDVLVLQGADGELRHAIAAAVADVLHMRLLLLRADVIPAAPEERVDLLRLLERECVLRGGAVLIEQSETPERGAERALAHALETLSVPVMVSGDHAPLVSRGMLVSEIAPLTHNELLDAWQAALGESAATLNGSVARAAGQFRLGLDAIAAVGLAMRNPDNRQQAQLWTLCRTFARPRLDGLAQRIEPAASWDDLVLPPAQLEMLRSIALHVRHRTTVHQDWGFGRQSSRGQGISALFSGPSGTGKTMAAEVLANELQLDLYRIDLSQVVSKYIGETEKNLRRVFDAAEGGSAILLFDEADALFGKRSDVKDSHDRYANIEVSYLLQRMEAYHGLAVLTTNHPSALDLAFLRRLRFAVTFPFPDNSARAEIWRRAFPAHAPTDGLQPNRLARLNVAGGNIRNIALHAAFYAAAAGESVGMPHLLRAARLEYAKLERPLTETELAGWT
ncbi:MAG: ATP-binding protein [Longimicrobiales bacterium]